MSSGTPVATVNMAPLTEMVDESVGGLFEMGNPGDLSNTVNEMLSNPKARFEQSKAGRELVLSKYTYEHNAKDFLAIYQSIIEQSQEPLK